MTHSIINVLYISPSTSVKGGITTVIKGYLGSDLAKRYNIITVSSHRDGNKFIKAYSALSGLILTLFYMIFKHIDIVHIHGSDTTSSLRKYLYLKIVELFSCKIIYHFHGASFLELYHEKTKIWQGKVNYLFERVNAVICLSQDWERKINKLIPQANTLVVENAVKLPKKQKIDFTLKNNIIQLLFLGLIGDRKGIFDLLKVVKKLKTSGYKVKLSIGGNGDINRLLEEIEALELENEVAYLGWVTAKEKEILFEQMDVYILPSYGEGMPMSILEAMSYGLPVISTNVGGIPNLIKDNETGFLIEPGDQITLYSAIEKLLKDEMLRAQLGEKSRILIENKYNLNTNILKIDTIYQELLRKEV